MNRCGCHLRHLRPWVAGATTAAGSASRMLDGPRMLSMQRVVDTRTYHNTRWERVCSSRRGRCSDLSCP
jgi:hypothetical protein